MNAGSFAAVVLAAGLGKRMKSRLPKVLHRVCGRPMAAFVIDAVKEAGAGRVIVVIGHGEDQVRSALEGPDIDFVIQGEQLGTGHAALQSRPLLDDVAPDFPILVVGGDMPLITPRTYRSMIETLVSAGAAATPLTALFSDPVGYGRVLRGPHGEFAGIVEEPDATEDQARIREVCPLAYAFRAGLLFQALGHVGRGNRQGEYYLPDAAVWLAGEGHKVAPFTVADESEGWGVNSRRELARVEGVLRQRVRDRLMDEGVTFVAPETVLVDADVTVGPDTVLGPFTCLEAGARVGSDCVIGPFSRLVASRVGAGSVVANSVIVGSVVGERVNVGPFAYIRPGSEICEGAKVGDFVEIKKSRVGRGSKVPHLSYVGDTTVGEGVNVGAGTITCNYDGFRKHVTVIQDGAFIGSNANLVAPVTIGKGAYVAAGSTITRDVPEDALGIARARQGNLEGWAVNRRAHRERGGGA